MSIVEELLWDDYFKWMCKIVCDDDRPRTLSYRELLRHLHSIPFEYRILKDENRAADGVDLRRRFSMDNLADMRYFDRAPCSVLEMLVALSIRCEESIMDDPTVGDRTSQWFWGMIVNLGLGSMTDTHYDPERVERSIRKFMNREYEPNGKGGLFTLDYPREDLRKVEIWYQMCWYLDENFY